MASSDVYGTDILSRLHTSIYHNLRADMVKDRLYLAVRHQLCCPLVILRRNLRQRLKPCVRICRHSSERRRVQVSIVYGIRDPAGKSILVHA